jgi:hypothetical protein
MKIVDVIVKWLKRADRKSWLIIAFCVISINGIILLVRLGEAVYIRSVSGQILARWPFLFQTVLNFLLTIVFLYFLWGYILGTRMEVD